MSMMAPVGSLEVSANGHSNGLSQVPDTATQWQPYPEYRDSGVDWLGEIPAHWDVRRLDGVFQDRRDSVEPSQFISCEVFHYSIPVIEETGDGRVEDGSDIDSNKLLLRGGELIISKLNPRKSRVLITQSHNQLTICSTEFVVLYSNRCDLRYGFYLFSSEPVRQYLSARVDSVTRSHQRVNPDVIKKMWWAFPSLTEQRAIADFLDRETAKLDTLIAKKQRMIALLQEKRTALISHVVTKGIDPSVPMKDSGVEWLGEIPAHWEIKSLKHVTPDDRPIMYGIVLPGPNVENGIPIVKGGDVSPARLRLELLNRTTPEIEAPYARSRLRSGDLVYAIRGSIGMVAMIPHEIAGANLTQDAARVAYRTEVDGDWLLFTLQSQSTFKQLDAGAIGATIRGINIRDLKRAIIPLPSPQEQRAIAHFLNLEIAKIDALTVKLQQHIQKVQEYRTALISAAVTGKIDVRQAL